MPNKEELKWQKRGEKIGNIIFSLIKPICYALSAICFLLFCFLTGKKPPTGSGGIKMG